jgi:hypothetical protein
MPPHLHRRTPLRQSMPTSAGVLLLPPHYPKAHRQPETTPQPPLHLPPAPARRPLRHPILHRPGPAAHRLQRHRPPPRRPPPLRPPDRQPQPPQTPIRLAQGQHRRRTRRNRRRDHHRPRAGHHRPTHRTRPRRGTPQHSRQAAPQNGKTRSRNRHSAGHSSYRRRLPNTARQ